MNAEVFVDLSNVAKDESLGPSHAHASLTRWDLLKASWLRSGRPEVEFLLIADSSLPRALDRHNVGRLQAMVGEGTAVLVPDADVEVLQRAVLVGGVALSNDRYVDYRRIAGLERARLVGWTARAGKVRFIDRSLERLLSAVISRRALKQELKGQGLDVDAPELSRRWYCRHSPCDRTLVAVPHVKRGQPVCPDCGSFLDAGQPWRNPVWIKVALEGEELERFVLEEGEAVFVGGSQEGHVADASDEIRVEVPKLEPRHLELLNRGGNLLVRDNDSEAGTRIRMPAPGNGNHLSPPIPVPPDHFTAVGIGSKVLLGRGGLTLQRAGRPG